MKAKRKLKLNATHLKIIAIIAMTIDHIADLLYPGFSRNPVALALHFIGRLTAPIMWFFICEGYHYTRNLKKYLLRMFLFAFISHFAYCFAFGISYIPFSDGIFNQTSVMWPLAWSVVALWMYHSKNKLKKWQKYIFLLIIIIVTFPSDWSCIAVMAILFMYGSRKNTNKQMLFIYLWVFIYAVVSYYFVNKTYAIIQLGVVFVHPLLNLYSGKRGKVKGFKWFFYIYYPLHLIIIGILRLLMYGDVPLLF